MPISDEKIISGFVIEDFPRHAYYISNYVKVWGDHYPINGEIKGRVRTTERGWVFSTNNHEEDWKGESERVFNEQGLMYIIGGRECPPSTGTPHIQDYLRCNKQVCRRQITSWFPNTHIEQLKEKSPKCNIVPKVAVKYVNMTFV